MTFIADYRHRQRVLPGGESRHGDCGHVARQIEVQNIGGLRKYIYTAMKIEYYCRKQTVKRYHTYKWSTGSDGG